VRAPTQGGEKIWGGQIYRGMLKVHPQAESARPRLSKSPSFLKKLGSWTVGEVSLVVLMCVLRAMTKKELVSFLGEGKVHPPYKILAMAMKSAWNQTLWSRARP